MNQLAQHGCVLFDDCAKPGPEAFTAAVTARRGITSGKLRCFALEHEAVDRAQKAESKSRVGWVVVVAIENRTAQAPSPDVLRRLAQQCGVEV
jgi:hypothetical protein